MAYKYENVYEPEEDSELLLKHTISELKHFFIGKSIQQKQQHSLCEVGVGSGFVSTNLAKQFPNIQFFASDINSSAIDLTKLEFSLIKTTTKPNIQNKPFFEGFKKEQKFDTIIFNTPYFPFESKKDNFKDMTMKDRAIYGGINGYEVINEFIELTIQRLNPDGFCIMIFSSLSNYTEIEKVLIKNSYNYSMLESENSFFEKIHCLKFWPKNDLKQVLKNKEITNLKYLSLGKHSSVFQCDFNNINCIVKIGKEQHLEKEGFFEEKLKDEFFVPKMYYRHKNYIVREMYTGQTIEHFIDNPNTTLKELTIVLSEILKACFRIDELKITKFEMTNPYKHIYIESDLSIGFIDFERCIFADKPKNTTQILQYFRRNIPKFGNIGLKLSNEKILYIGKKYRDDLIPFTIQDILELK
ncbi:MAG: methyltransferase [Nanoarchaeales archaeon]|nr:methyltransferase [Nanoarchaeales archaeon]